MPPKTTSRTRTKAPPKRGGGDDDEYEIAQRNYNLRHPQDDTVQANAVNSYISKNLPDTRIDLDKSAELNEDVIKSQFGNLIDNTTYNDETPIFDQIVSKLRSEPIGKFVDIELENKVTKVTWPSLSNYPSSQLGGSLELIALGLIVVVAYGILKLYMNKRERDNRIHDGQVDPNLPMSSAGIFGGAQVHRKASSSRKAPAKAPAKAPVKAPAKAPKNKGRALV